MTDTFQHHQDQVTGPARNPYAVTPHDSQPLPAMPRRLYVGTGGDLCLRGVDSANDVLYRNVGDGVYLNVRASYVRATGTTASDIVAEA